MQKRHFHPVFGIAVVLLFSLVFVLQIMAEDGDKRTTDPQLRYQGDDRDTVTELFGTEEKEEREVQQATLAYQKESLRLLEEIRDLLKKIEENTKPRASK